MEEGEEEDDPRGIFDLFSHDQNTRCLCVFVLRVWLEREIESRLHCQRCGWIPKPEMTARKTRSTRTQKKTEPGSGSGLLSPPSSSGDKTGDRDAAGPSSAMISPPPEEDEDRRSKVSALSFHLKSLSHLRVFLLRPQPSGMLVFTTASFRVLITGNSNSFG